MAEDQEKFIANVTEDGFLDISTEVSRTYHYKNGVEFVVQDPMKLHVKRSDRGDSHRIIDDEGTGWYISPGWLAISWTVRDGPAISF